MMRQLPPRPVLATRSGAGPGMLAAGSASSSCSEERRNRTIQRRCCRFSIRSPGGTSMRAQCLRGFRGIDGSIVRAFVHVLVMVAASVPRPTEAQDAHFKALTIPPQNVGSCLPPLATADSASPVRPGGRLVMKSLEPGSSREIHMFSDQSGQRATYTEIVSVTAMARPIRSEGTMIAAFLLPGVGVAGSRTETVVTVPDSVLNSRDVAMVRAILENRNTTQTSRPLDSTEQRRVQEMIDFMRKRCP